MPQQTYCKSFEENDELPSNNKYFSLYTYSNPIQNITQCLWTNTINVVNVDRDDLSLHSKSELTKRTC